MDLLLKNAVIIDPGSPFHQKKVNLLIHNGVIQDISEKSPAQVDSNTKVFDQENTHVSPCWIDLFADFCDPGNEHRETLESGREAAFDGGFGAVGIIPETNPPVQSKEGIRYINRQNFNHPVELLPFGAISKELEGENLTEMYDLFLAGAAGFTDGNRPVSHTELLVNGMEYSHNFNLPFMVSPRDRTLEGNGMVHEGKIHLELGVKSIPSLAEELMVKRDLSVCEYTGAPLHFTKISSAHSVKLIAEAKKAGLPVTAGVSVNNLVFTENDLTNFDTNLKLTPPLRAEEDRKALIKGLKKGTIDVIVSDHRPIEDEWKNCDFENAKFGALGLQTLMPAALKALDFDLETLVKAIAINPAKILKKEPVTIDTNQKAELTLFNPKLQWDFNTGNNRSLSHNSPFFDQSLPGRAIGLIKNGEFYHLNKANNHG